MPPLIDNDMLGAKGEAIFDGCCAEAGLVSNPSSRDRTGWDRIVEFPHSRPAELVTIDARPAPISCHIQIKTVSAGARSCRLRLSSAERLAKDPKPAFIYVICDASGRSPSAVLIHMIGPALERILKRLRKEHRDGGSDTQVNKKYIKLPLSLGTSLPLTGAALRAAIEQAVGGPNALQDCIARKTTELATIGYDGSSHIGSFTIQSASWEELVDGCLGLRSLTSTSFTASERRFGIEIPLVSYEGIKGELRIAPTTPRACRLVCKSGAARPAAVLDGELRVPGLPGLPEQNVKLLFRHPLFDMTIPLAKDRSFRLSGNEATWSSSKFDARVWLNMHRLIACLREAGATLQLHSEGLPLIEFVSKSAIGTVDAANNQYCEHVSANLVRLQELLSLDSLPVSCSEMLAGAEEIANALAFADDQAGDAFAKFTTTGGDVPLGSPIPFLYFYAFPVGNACVHYAVRTLAHASVATDGVHWSLDAKEFVDIGWSNDPEHAFAAFQDRVIARTKINSRMAWNSPSLSLPPDSPQNEQT